MLPYTHTSYLEEVSVWLRVLSAWLTALVLSESARSHSTLLLELKGFAGYPPQVS